MRKIVLLSAMLFLITSLGCSKQEKTSNQNIDTLKKSDSSKVSNSQTTQSTNSPTKDSVPVPKQTDEEIISEATNGVFNKESGQTKYKDEFGDMSPLTTYEAVAIDLNDDGQKEVFVQLLDGNWPKGFYTLYMKKDGRWYKEYECMDSYSIASSKTKGYMDINLNAAVGNDKSLARWNGKMYVDKRGKKPCDF